MAIKPCGGIVNRTLRWKIEQECRSPETRFNQRVSSVEVPLNPKQATPLGIPDHTHSFPRI